MSEFENIIINKIDEIITNLSSNNWIQNLISTLAGVILGFLLTVFYQRIGKLKYYIVSSSIEYFKKSIRGSLEKSSFDENVVSSEIEIVIDFQNTSQNNIGIKNIEIVLEEKANSIRIQPRDLETRRLEHFMIISDTVEILNIEPHTVLRKKINAFIDEEKIKKIGRKPDVYLSFIENSKKILVKINE